MGNEKLFKPMAVSYNRQSELVHEGMERQDKRNRSLAESRGIPVLMSLFDNDVSASKPRGPKTDWGHLLQLIETGRANTVIATDMDRLLRTPRDLLTLIDLGAKVLTVDGEIDLTTADGEFRSMLLASLARFEVRRKGERQKRANEHRARKGIPGGIWAPFGYDKDLVTIIPEQAAAIRNGVEMFLGGVNIAAIARSWNDAGFITNRNTPFNAQAVKLIFRNPRYIGQRAYNGTVVAKGTWEAILEESTWQAVQAKLDARKRQITPASTPKHLLSGGILRCDVCGEKLGIGYPRAGYRIYRCKAKHVSRSADVLEQYLGTMVAWRLSQPDAHELALSSDVEELAQLRDEAQELRGRQSYLTMQYAVGTIPVEALNDAIAEVGSRLDGIESQLAMAARADVLAPLLGAPDIQQAWDALPLERQRAAFVRLMTVKVRAIGKGNRAPFTADQVEISWLN